MRAGENPADSTVLVVEDDRDIRELVCLLIEGELGLEVREASDGAVALRLIKKEMPSLVVTDVNMPRLNGVELVRRLRRSRATRALRILIVAASPKAREEATRAGADDYIDKPFNAEVLTDKVREQLGRIAAAAG